MVVCHVVLWTTSVWHGVRVLGGSGICLISCHCCATDCLFRTIFVWDLWILCGHVLRIRVPWWVLLHGTVSHMDGLDHRLVVICFTVRCDKPVLWTCCSVDLYVMLSRTFASILLTTSYNSRPITRMYHGEGWSGLFARLFHCRRYVWRYLLVYMLIVILWIYCISFYVLIYPMTCFMYFDTLRGCVLSNVYLYFLSYFYFLNFCFAFLFYFSYYVLCVRFS